MVDISIILPVYNSGKYLNSAIDSILNQSFENFELIIIDDGSTDMSYNICLDYEKKDKRVHVFHQKNKGICSARNLGIMKAKGDYIAFCDHDDIYLPGLLEHCIEVAKKESSDIVKYGYRFEVVDEKGKMIRKPKTISAKKGVITNIKSWNDFKYYYGTIESVWNGIYKRNLITEYGVLFDENIKFGLEDICFCIDLYRHTKSVSFIEEEYYVHYKRTTHSTSAKYNINRIESEKIRWNKLNNMFNMLEGEPDKNLIIKCIFNQVNSITGQLCHKSCDLDINEKKHILQMFYKIFVQTVSEFKIDIDKIGLKGLQKHYLKLFFEMKFIEMLLIKKIYYLLQNII